jgi:mannose-6-phosphate isomerase-like protein (cupin superfamily)
MDTKNKDKSEIFDAIEASLRKHEMQIVSTDKSRPWGGFFVIAEEQADQFIRLFFRDVVAADLRISGKLSPKILVVEPGKRLSWQYHFRRAEIWSVIHGTVAVVLSDDDIEREMVHLTAGHTIRLKQGQRHRLVGLDGWGIVAEIWQHTDALHPSDEEDIVRLQDDFGR